MKHSFWHQVPVIKLLLPFASGIGLSMFYPFPFTMLVGIWVLLACSSILCFVGFKRYSFRWIFGCSISVLLVWSGMLLHRLQDERLDVSFAAHQLKAEYWLVQIDEQPMVKASSIKMQGKVLAVSDSSGRVVKASGRLMIYLAKALLSPQIEYGRWLWVPQDCISEIKGPQNPAEFDYQRYLSFHGIYHQAYVGKSNQLLITNQVHGNPLWIWTYGVQSYVKRVLQRNINSANETAVAQALLYGFDDDIDAETVKAYSNTGTLHVLAVSGMHVGIIYLILGWILGWLSRWKWGEVVKQVSMLAVLWLYSLLCGLSPSILRSTVMFSFIIVGNLLQTRSNIYNTLAASAFVLLCVDPNMIANVGFQLSYLAVIGIVFFQPYLYQMYTPKSFWVDEIWKITSVSLAAQLVTFPIGLLYFHQFPNCFLFSNLIIIPLTTVILYGGLILVAIGSMGWIAWLLGQVLYALIHFTNQIVVWVEHIPMAYVNGIQISILQTLLLYAILICLTVFLFTTYKSWLFLGLCLLISAIGISSYQRIQHQQQQLLVVHRIQHATAVQIVIGNHGILLLDSALAGNENKRRFHLQQFIWQQHITQQKLQLVDSNWHEFKVNQTSIVLAGQGIPSCSSKAQYLVTSFPLALDQLKTMLSFESIILTSALERKEAQRMQSWCNRNGIQVYDVAEKGAFVANLLDSTNTSF